MSRIQLASLKASILLLLFLRNSIHLLPIAHIWHTESYERASVLFEGNYSFSQEIQAELSSVFVVTNLLQIILEVSNFRIAIFIEGVYLIPIKLLLRKLLCDRKHLWRKQGGEVAGIWTQRTYTAKTLLNTAQVAESFLLQWAVYRRWRWYSSS